MQTCRAGHPAAFQGPATGWIRRRWIYGAPHSKALDLLHAPTADHCRLNRSTITAAPRDVTATRP